MLLLWNPEADPVRLLLLGTDQQLESAQLLAGEPGALDVHGGSTADDAAVIEWASRLV